MTDLQQGLGERVGNKAHGAPDSGNALKGGGHATAGLRAAVDEDDRVDASYDLEGRARVRSEGDAAHDTPDGGNPGKGGGRARTSAIGAVANDDRVDQIMTPTGGLMVAGAQAGNPTNIEVSAAGSVLVEGNISHDIPETGRPISTGLNAAEFNSDPPQVSADNDRVRAIATPQGIQFVLGGHPNLITKEYMTTTVQTNSILIPSVAAGSQVIITEIEVLVSSACTVKPQVRIGFGTSGVPGEPTTGTLTSNMVLSHPGIAAGSGVVRGNGSGIVAIGGDGMELRLACDVPTGDKITVILSYYISSL